MIRNTDSSRMQLSLECFSSTQFLTLCLYYYYYDARREYPKISNRSLGHVTVDEACCLFLSKTRSVSSTNDIVNTFVTLFAVHIWRNSGWTSPRQALTLAKLRHSCCMEWARPVKRHFFSFLLLCDDCCCCLVKKLFCLAVNERHTYTWCKSIFENFKAPPGPLLTLMLFLERKQQNQNIVVLCEYTKKCLSARQHKAVDSPSSRSDRISYWYYIEMMRSKAAAADNKNPAVYITKA